MIKVNDGQDPYSIIGEYIREHMTAIEDMIAIIEIDGHIINELFMVDMDADGYFVWKSDWWEGEKNVSLVDFFPVSDAQKPSAQPEIIYCGDCKYASPNGVYGCRLERFSAHDESIRLFAGDYCSAAERRTDGVDS